MRLGKKKEKDKEAEIRSVDGIIRLICLSKGQAPLKGKKYFFIFISLSYIYTSGSEIFFSSVCFWNIG